MHEYFLLLCSVHNSPSAFSVGGLLLFNSHIKHVSNGRSANTYQLRKFRLLHSTSFDDAIQILAERFTNLLAYCRNIPTDPLLRIFYFHRMLLAILKI